MHDQIKVKGAREHNLKSLSVEIPRDQLVVITGVSGSGKSSLAFDTIYAEGERRYLESLSTYARQFLGKMKKPDLDSIDGLSPSISIQQHSIHGNPRSIVGTVTEIYDYYRLLWARVGVPHCPYDGKKLSAVTIDEIVEKVLALPEGTKFLILSPQVRNKKGTHADLLKELKNEGFLRVRLNGEMKEIDEVGELDKNLRSTIDIVVDRLKMREGLRSRLTDSLETALRRGNGIVYIQNLDTNEQKTYSEKYFCEEHNFSVEDIEPSIFSFNSPRGACPECLGLGEIKEFDPELMVEEDLSVNAGALITHPPSQRGIMSMIRALSEKYGFSLNVPFKELSDEAKQIILYGSDDELEVDWDSNRFTGTVTYRFEGIVPNLKRRYYETHSDGMREWMEKYMVTRDCPVCGGQRLRPEALSIKIEGKSIIDVTKMGIDEAVSFFEGLKEKLSENELRIAERIFREIFKRLGFIQNVGLSYISLFRKASTLSGGEFQRIRLATQIGSGLMGVLYVLDEPTIGLHSRDTAKLLSSLEELRDAGNTVLVVEHDEDTMARADYILDIGPGAGVYGGNLVAAGTLEEIKKNEKSLTGQYLSGKKKIEMPKNRREGNGLFLMVKGAREHNLKNIDVSFPLGKFICVTGVSGSGKSSLVNDILFNVLRRHFYRSAVTPGDHDIIEGMEHIDKVIDIDQSPIGRTPRSNPVTYTGVFNHIRDLFANLPEAKMRGYKSGRFSFNVKGGRCEACQGAGSVKVEMHFLPDVFLTCEVCGGARYNKETLQVKYKEKSIADVLDMTVDEAVDFFENIPVLKRKFKVLQDVGLGYIHLGQSATTLSGGEAQRIKLARELSKIGTGKTLYILDEPSVGLHFEDVKKLIAVLQRLADKGNTVMVIEHNLDIVKSSDWVIDLGPEGGGGGGTVIAEGTPEEIAKVEKSYTGQYLKKLL